LPDYSKGDPLIFDKVKAGMDGAVARAKQLRRETREADSYRPSTDMPALVEVLGTIVGFDDR
jgi:hypothetical protein